MALYKYVYDMIWCCHFFTICTVLFNTHL